MALAPSKKKKRKPVQFNAGLNITSMMDMLTIILLFLLNSFYMESEALSIDPRKLRLPVSTAREAPKPRLVIQITRDEIIVDGKMVARVDEAVHGDELIIHGVQSALDANTERLAYIAKTNISLNFTGEVIIQGDQEIPYALLEKIMYTCGQAGYSNISLAVLSSE